MLAKITPEQYQNLMSIASYIVCDTEFEDFKDVVLENLPGEEGCTWSEEELETILDQATHFEALPEDLIKVIRENISHIFLDAHDAFDFLQPITTVIYSTADRESVNEYATKMFEEATADMVRVACADPNRGYADLGSFSDRTIDELGRLVVRTVNKALSLYAKID